MVATWLLLHATSCQALMMDVLHKAMIPPKECKHGCAPWSTKPSTWWAHGTVPADAGASCAQPARVFRRGCCCAFCRTERSSCPYTQPTRDRAQWRSRTEA